jgi:hypothetical protein
LIDQRWREGNQGEAKAILSELFTARDEVLAALLQLQIDSSKMPYL